MYVKLNQRVTAPAGTNPQCLRSGGLLVARNKEFNIVKVKTTHIWDEPTQTVSLNRHLRGVEPRVIFFEHIPGARLRTSARLGQIVAAVFVLGFDHSLSPLKRSTTIVGRYLNLEDALVGVQQHLASNFVNDVRISYDYFGDNMQTQVVEKDTMGLAIRYQASNAASRVADMLGAVEYAIHLNIQEEDMMGQQMWVAGIGGNPDRCSRGGGEN